MTTQPPAQELPELSQLNELAKVYATSYASPHHITFTVDGLRNLLACIAASQAPRTEATGNAETYLRSRYGAYRGHFAWRELEEAFNAGVASQAGRAPVALVDCRNGDMKAHWTLPRQDLEHGTQLFAGPPLEVREAMSEEQIEDLRGDANRAIETQSRYIGAVMGWTYQWNKGADKPYILIRELSSQELIRCNYSDGDYAKVAKLFENKTAIVIIEGTISFNLITSKTEMLLATGFEFAPDFSEEDFDKFFGMAPDMTRGLTSEEFVAKGRNEQ